MSGKFDIPMVCLLCGKFYEPWSYRDMCKGCISATARVRAGYFYAAKRATGWIPESKRRAGRRAFYSRMANLKFNDPARFDRLFNNYKQRFPHMAGQITRKINQRSI